MKFKVIFTEKTKYNAMTRSAEVETKNLNGVLDMVVGKGTKMIDGKMQNKKYIVEEVRLINDDGTETVLEAPDETTEESIVESPEVVEADGAVPEIMPLTVDDLILLRSNRDDSI